MNLLFLKNRKVSLFIVCIGVLFYSFTSFVKDTNDDPFVTLCKNSDAYYKHTYQDITYDKYLLGYRRYVSIDNKLVVNNSNGVEEYAFLNLDEYQSNRIKSIQIRTLKSDGSIVELDSSLVFKRTSKRKPFGAIKHPIPAVEPGDTIETKYVYYENLEKSDLRAYVNLYTSIPSINSQYTVKTGTGFSVRYKTYNDFPEPEVVSNDSLIYLQFSADKVKGLELNEHSCLFCEKPYFYYTIENRDKEFRTWKNVYNEEFNILTQPMAIDREKSSYYKRWKRNTLGTAKDSSKYYQFRVLHTDILDNFSMKPPNPEEIIKSSGYFLKKKRFDMISIRRFYRQLLEDLEIDYWAVFGKNKQSGPIDMDYIRKGEFEHIFFAFKDENGILKFLYPNEEFYNYQLDEIPTSLYDTKAVLARPFLKKKKRKKDKFITRNFQLAMADSVLVATVKMPGIDYNRNYIQQTISSTVDLDEKKTSFRYRLQISGGYSTELRSFFSMLDKDKEASDYYDALSKFEGDDNTIQIDTITSRIQKRNKPFSFVMSGKGVINNAISFINDSLVSVSIEKLIQHDQLENNTSTSDLDYYLDYNYSDRFLFYLNFPCDIQVLGLENGKIDYTNDFSEYSFELTQSKNNQLKFQSNYKILKNLIPKEKLEELKTLNEQVKNVKNKRLIVKLKRN
ncbi:hypothetical protein KORDIASMS9_03260 [Kordia sp. SMS9]|uniref:DUF3857 domain-containing protein n=1 Tax=Kordia sp. SMS9 TaxID=2282170 RepID=UPI000E0CDA1B|nr:DUF3857 domain-containing protein [Kordia sp. SMS9]AXG71005.1 hypothetical protein KORDIASMS9_03260 [Kordia sp. SMS9]